MFNELNNLLNPSLAKGEPTEVSISRFISSSEGGIRDLIEVQFYRESCMEIEKKRSSLLNATLDKLIEAMAPVK